MSQPVLRVATEADAESLSVLASVTFTDTFGHLYPPEDLSEHLTQGYTPAAFRSLLVSSGDRFWLSEKQGRAVAYAQAGPCRLPHPEASSEYGELRRFYLLPEVKGTGLAQRMMGEVLAWLEERFPGPLWLGVYCDNLRAQRFYTRFGFVKVGDYEYPVGGTRDHEFILRRG